jgi:signal transduction histidine kinase
MAATVLALVLLYFGVTRLAAAYRGTAARLERLRLEVVEAAGLRTRELEGLSGQVAHELKNPLSSIKGLVQLTHKSARSGQASAQMEQRLSVVLQEVLRLEGVLAGYLSFTRPIAEVRPVWGELSEFIGEFALLIEGQAATSGVRVLLEVQPCSLYVDAVLLRQALLNLAQNAFLAMPDGGTLTIRGKPRASQVRIELCDDGCGMSAKDLGRVAEPFFTRRSGGTGLGVVIANRIIRQHGGRLTFESAPEQGTTVHIDLPQQGPTPG